MDAGAAAAAVAHPKLVAVRFESFDDVCSAFKNTKAQPPITKLQDSSYVVVLPWAEVEAVVASAQLRKVAVRVLKDIPKAVPGYDHLRQSSDAASAPLTLERFAPTSSLVAAIEYAFALVLHRMPESDVVECALALPTSEVPPEGRAWRALVVTLVAHGCFVSWIRHPECARILARELVALPWRELVRSAAAHPAPPLQISAAVLGLARALPSHRWLLVWPLYILFDPRRELCSNAQWTELTYQSFAAGVVREVLETLRGGNVLSADFLRVPPGAALASPLLVLVLREMDAREVVSRALIAELLPGAILQTLLAAAPASAISCRHVAVLHSVVEGCCGTLNFNALRAPDCWVDAADMLVAMLWRDRRIDAATTVRCVRELRRLTVPRSERDVACCVTAFSALARAAPVSGAAVTDADPVAVVRGLDIDGALVVEVLDKWPPDVPKVMHEGVVGALVMRLADAAVGASAARPSGMLSMVGDTLSRVLFGRNTRVVAFLNQALAKERIPTSLMDVPSSGLAVWTVAARADVQTVGGLDEHPRAVLDGLQQLLRVTTEKLESGSMVLSEALDFFGPRCGVAMLLASTSPRTAQCMDPARRAVERGCAARDELMKAAAVAEELLCGRCTSGSASAATCLVGDLPAAHDLAARAVLDVRVADVVEWVDAAMSPVWRSVLVAGGAFFRTAGAVQRLTSHAPLLQALAQRVLPTVTAVLALYRAAVTGQCTLRDFCTAVLQRPTLPTSRTFDAPDVEDVHALLQRMRDFLSLSPVRDLLAQTGPAVELALPPLSTLCAERALAALIMVRRRERASACAAALLGALPALGAPAELGAAPALYALAAPAALWDQTIGQVEAAAEAQGEVALRLGDASPEEVALLRMMSDPACAALVQWLRANRQSADALLRDLRDEAVGEMRDVAADLVLVRQALDPYLSRDPPATEQAAVALLAARPCDARADQALRRVATNLERLKQVRNEAMRDSAQRALDEVEEVMLGSFVVTMPVASAATHRWENAARGARRDASNLTLLQSRVAVLRTSERHDTLIRAFLAILDTVERYCTALTQRGTSGALRHVLHSAQPVDKRIKATTPVHAIDLLIARLREESALWEAQLARERQQRPALRALGMREVGAMLRAAVDVDNTEALLEAWRQCGYCFPRMSLSEFAECLQCPTPRVAMRAAAAAGGWRCTCAAADATVIVAPVCAACGAWYCTTCAHVVASGTALCVRCNRAWRCLACTAVNISSARCAGCEVWRCACGSLCAASDATCVMCSRQPPDDAAAVVPVQAPRGIACAVCTADGAMVAGRCTVCTAWACETCTSHNAGDFGNCGVCDAAQTPASRARSVSRKRCAADMAWLVNALHECDTAVLLGAVDTMWEQLARRARETDVAVARERGAAPAPEVPAGWVRRVRVVEAAAEAVMAVTLAEVAGAAGPQGVLPLLDARWFMCCAEDTPMQEVTRVLLRIEHRDAPLVVLMDAHLLARPHQLLIVERLAHIAARGECAHTLIVHANHRAPVVSRLPRDIADVVDAAALPSDEDMRRLMRTPLRVHVVTGDGKTAAIRRVAGVRGGERGGGGDNLPYHLADELSADALVQALALHGPRTTSAHGVIEVRAVRLARWVHPPARVQRALLQALLLGYVDAPPLRPVVRAATTAPLHVAIEADEALVACTPLLRWLDVTRLPAPREVLARLAPGAAQVARAAPPTEFERLADAGVEGGLDRAWRGERAAAHFVARVAVWCARVGAADKSEAPLAMARTVDVTPEEEVRVLIAATGLPEPSWRTLANLVAFLDGELRRLEDPNASLPMYVQQHPGLGRLLVYMTLRLAKDFATPALAAANARDLYGSNLLQAYALTPNSRWAERPAPYVVQGTGGHGVQFLGDPMVDEVMRLCDRDGRPVDEAACMTQAFYVEELLPYRLLRPTAAASAAVGEAAGEVTPASVPRSMAEQQQEFVSQLARLLPAGGVVDEDLVWGRHAEYMDETPGGFVITGDTIKKLAGLAVRWRNGLPSVIMGEAGCGKTAPVQFLARLMGAQVVIEKLAGGTTLGAIHELVKRAEGHAQRDGECGAVLFLDECNACEHVGAIEVLLLEKLVFNPEVREWRPVVGNVHVVAACNPYRRLPARLLERLQRAGMGYLWDDAHAEQFGAVPMRHLTYRVRPLGEAIVPLIADYGRLDPAEEEQYIRCILADPDTPAAAPQPAAPQPQASPPQAARDVPMRPPPAQGMWQPPAGPGRIHARGRGGPPSGGRRAFVPHFFSGAAGDDSAGPQPHGLPGMFAAFAAPAVPVGAVVGVQRAAAGAAPAASSTPFARHRALFEAGGFPPPDMGPGFAAAPGVPVTMLCRCRGRGCPRCLVAQPPPAPGAAAAPRAAARRPPLSAAARAVLDPAAWKLLADAVVMVHRALAAQPELAAPVSLRDVQRARLLHVFFSTHLPLQHVAYGAAAPEPFVRPGELTEAQLSALLAVVVGYGGRAADLEGFMDDVAQCFGVESGGRARAIVRAVQEAVTRQCAPGERVLAYNTALVENFFTMVVCAALKIPLFIVARPGTAKSLAKTLLEASMRGPLSQNEFFRRLPELVVRSYQCMPLSQPETILDVFASARHIQKQLTAHTPARRSPTPQRRRGTLVLPTAVGMVGLDEIGQAQAAPRMPLRVLHGLLEDERPDERVAVLALSNWAIDSSILSRGLYLTRAGLGHGNDEEDLLLTARGLCGGQDGVPPHAAVARMLPPIVRVYLRLTRDMEASDGDFVQRELHRLRGLAPRDEAPTPARMAAVLEDGGVDGGGIDVDAEVAAAEAARAAVAVADIGAADEDDSAEGLGLPPGRELYGLRNMYSLCSQLRAWAVANPAAAEVPWEAFERMVRRDFGGVRFLPRVLRAFSHALGYPPVPSHLAVAAGMSGRDMILECLNDASSRFPLVIVHDLAALSLVVARLLEPAVRRLRATLPAADTTTLPPLQVVFGPAFADDCSHTHICRSIRQVKAAMEAGSWVVLLDAKELYEPLYDLLCGNFIVEWGQRYSPPLSLCRPSCTRICCGAQVCDRAGGRGE